MDLDGYKVREGSYLVSKTVYNGLRQAQRSKMWVQSGPRIYSVGVGMK